MNKEIKILFILRTVIIVLMSLLCLPVFSQTSQPGDGGFNYGEALQKAILFYEYRSSMK